jgi:predicted XRE-type DNA-binding protein
MNDETQNVRLVDDDLLDLLCIPNASDERARVDLAAAITLEIRRRRLTQNAAAALLGITASEVSAIMNVRIDGFSAERLQGLLKTL